MAVVSASEKLKALPERPGDEPWSESVAWDRGYDAASAAQIASVLNALPQIVAVVEAAEGVETIGMGIPELLAALAALDEALS